jgi:hypothetical protein
MNISGSEPIDGYDTYLSSSQAELTGITAISITARLFLEIPLISYNAYNWLWQPKSDQKM